VNALEKDTGRTAIVSGPDDQRVDVNAGKVATKLEQQNTILDTNASNYINSEAFYSQVGPRELVALSGLEGVSGLTSNKLYMIAIVHEGIHAAYGAATQNMWVGVRNFNHDHQIPFNHVARDLLP
jgi:hypothetical protein